MKISSDSFFSPVLSQSAETTVPVQPRHANVRVRIPSGSTCVYLFPLSYNTSSNSCNQGVSKAVLHIIADGFDSPTPSWIEVQVSISYDRAIHTHLFAGHAGTQTKCRRL